MITSTTNPRIKAVRKLHQPKHRRREGLTIVEGPNGVDALTRSGTAPSEFFVLEDDIRSQRAAAELGVVPTIVSQTVLDAVSETKHAAGPVAVIAMPDHSPPRSVNTVCLVDVSDPGNVGTIIRTAVAFGWDVATSGVTADPWSPKSIRSAAGSTLEARISTASDPIATSVAADLAVVALVVSGGTPPAPSTAPVMLMVGSEAHGLPQELVDRAEVSMTIPAGGVESLNAATAAAIAMYTLTP